MMARESCLCPISTLIIFVEPCSSTRKFQHRNQEDFFYLASILRLSTKYFISHLRTQSIRYLSKTWSYSLRGHDDMVDMALNSPRIADNSYPYVHPMHVLNLARETNVLVVIPSALYFLSLYPLTDLLLADHPKLTVDHPSKPSSTLSPLDIKYYTLMFQHRLDIILDFVRRFCGERSATAGCTNLDGSACTKCFLRLSFRLSRSWMPRTGPLHYMVQAANQITEDQVICDTCRRTFCQDVSTLREEIWKGLPSVVSLSTWEELISTDLPST